VVAKSSGSSSVVVAPVPGGGAGLQAFKKERIKERCMERGKRLSVESGVLNQTDHLDKGAGGLTELGKAKRGKPERKNHEVACQRVKWDPGGN